MNNTVVTFVRSADDLAAIHELSLDGAVDVVAVALDLDGAGLRAMHDQARAAGARRCHALDVREEFARECLLPAAYSAADDPQVEGTLDRLARAFVERKLAQVASIEGAASVRPVTVLPPARCRETPLASRPAHAAFVAVQFENRVPVAINGIPMSVAELIDCLATVAAAHGVGVATAGVRVLREAYRQVAGSSPDGTGIGNVAIFNGAIQPAESTAITS